MGTKGTTAKWSLGVDGQAWLLFIASLVLLLGIWEYAVQAEWVLKLLPPPSRVAVDFWTAIIDPFYDNGPNDKGIGWNLLSSLRRVCVGFGLATLVAIPLGIVVGLSPILAKAIDPYVQVLKPISPLAWLPLGLAFFRNSEATAIFVIFITSLWPMLINTIFGVRSVNSSYLEVAATLGTSRLRTVTQVILPAAAPSIVTGMRISASIAWLVIVAAEILVGGTGLGYFVWNEWNNLNISNILVAILTIGFVGVILDRGFAWLEQRVRYEA